jgi:predicted  nucleic acid-binding Zn-ribbon protein
MLELLKKDWSQDIVDIMDELEDLNERYHEARRRAENLVEDLTNAKRVVINPSLGLIFVSTESPAQQIKRLSARVRELEAALRV